MKGKPEESAKRPRLEHHGLELDWRADEARMGQQPGPSHPGEISGKQVGPLDSTARKMSSPGMDHTQLSKKEIN